MLCAGNVLLIMFIESNESYYLQCDVFIITNNLILKLPKLSTH